MILERSLQRAVDPAHYQRICERAGDARRDSPFGRNRRRCCDWNRDEDTCKNLWDHRADDESPASCLRSGTVIRKIINNIQFLESSSKKTKS